MVINNMKTILVAVSGGPDSIYLLNKFRGNKKFNLIVCHINYKKRKSADRDEKIVENFCKNNNIKLETLIVTKEVEEQYIKFPNFQEKARHIRYDFFQKIGKENNTNILYVGHHKDDFIETAIMQERRSNDYLFYGLKEKNFLKDLTILRPLLNIYKNEILEYLFSNGISFGIDETNNDPKYERNKVRINLSKQSFKEKENIYKHFKTINKSKELISKKGRFYSFVQLSESE